MKGWIRWSFKVPSNLGCPMVLRFLWSSLIERETTFTAKNAAVCHRCFPKYCKSGRKQFPSRIHIMSHTWNHKNVQVNYTHSWRTPLAVLGFFLADVKYRNKKIVISIFCLEEWDKFVAHILRLIFFYNKVTDCDRGSACLQKRKSM